MPRGFSGFFLEFLVAFSSTCREEVLSPLTGPGVTGSRSPVCGWTPSSGARCSLVPCGWPACRERSPGPPSYACVFPSSPAHPGLHQQLELWPRSLSRRALRGRRLQRPTCGGKRLRSVCVHIWPHTSLRCRQSVGLTTLLRPSKTPPVSFGSRVRPVPSWAISSSLSASLSLSPQS